MYRFVKKVSKKAGMPPESLVYTGDKVTQKIKIEIIDYSEKDILEKELTKVEECFGFRDKPTTTWINVIGVNQPEIIQKIGDCYGFHPLILEDIVTVDQRPKLEDYETYIFLILKMAYYKKDSEDITAEQVSLIIGENYVISFQEEEGDVFDPIRQRIRDGKGKIRKMGSDYLAYSLVDAIVDNYFVILEKVGEEIEDIEDELIEKPTTKTLNRVYKLKRELLFLRKSIWPLREAISSLEKGESKIIKKTTQTYLRDVHDHTVQIIDTIETLRDMVSSMIEVYLSSISNRLNEVMKVLTVITTVFIPLTFITSIYGMNFHFMPELSWKWSYPILMIMMLMIFGAMFGFFKKKKWI